MKLCRGIITETVHPIAIDTTKLLSLQQASCSFGKLCRLGIFLPVHSHGVGNTSIFPIHSCYYVVDAGD